MLALFAALALAADPVADLHRGRALAEGGDLQGAIGAYRQVTAAFPAWGLAQIELAEALLRQGVDDASLDQALAAARALEPNNPRAWLLSGHRADRRADAAGAIECYGRAAELRPDLLDARERLGLLLLEAGRPSDAAGHLRAALAGKPDDRTLRANLADALERGGDLDGAEAELRALLAAAPKNPAYLRRLVDFLERTGQDEKAAHERRKADSGRPARKLRPLPPSRG